MRTAELLSRSDANVDAYGYAFDIRRDNAVAHANPHTNEPMKIIRTEDSLRLEVDNPHDSELLDQIENYARTVVERRYGLEPEKDER